MCSLRNLPLEGVSCSCMFEFDLYAVLITSVELYLLLVLLQAWFHLD